VVAAATGLVLGLVLYRLSGMYLAMATMAFDLIVTVVAVNGGDRTGGATGLYGVIVDIRLWHLFLFTGVCLLPLIWSELGRVGRRVEAVREDPELAASVGVPVRQYRLIAMVGSGAIGGIAGSLNVFARSYVGPLDVGFPLIVLALTIIIVGGARSWVGALAGAIIFTWLPDRLAFIGEWQTLIYGLIVAVAAIFLPSGLYGVATGGLNALRRVRRTRDLQRLERKDTAADEVEEDLAELSESQSEPQPEPQPELGTRA
jgi:branched-chain amino acid transport system permease protein